MINTYTVCFVIKGELEAVKVRAISAPNAIFEAALIVAKNHNLPYNWRDTEPYQGPHVFEGEEIKA